MNANYNPFRHCMGLKDTKQLAKALHRAIQTTPPTSPDSARQVVATLPWPPVRADQPVPQPPATPFLPNEADPRHAELVTWDPEHPCSFVALGAIAATPQGELFPQGKTLHWTHRGALAGGLVFGPKEERRVLLEQMVLQAALSGQSVFWVAPSQDTRHVDRLAQALADQGQAHRLRSINLLPGGATHTFNPMAQCSAQSIVENLVHTLNHRCPLPGMVQNDWTRFLFISMSAVAFAMVHHHNQRKTVPDIASFLKFCKLDHLAALEQQEEFPTQLRVSIRVFLREANTLPGGYDTVQNWLHQDDVLGALTDAFGHVFHTQYTGGHALLPDVSVRDLSHGNLITVLTVPDGAETAPRWILNHFSMELYLRTQQERPSSAVRQLIVLDSVGSYGTEVILNRLQQFASVAGVATVLADEDYPALKKMGTTAVEAVGRCHTKLFVKAAGPSEGLQIQVIENSQMHCLNLSSSTPSLPAPAYVPQSLGKTLEGNQIQQERFLERAAEVLWKSSRDHTSPVNLAWCQNTLARMLGYAHWHELEQQKRR